MPLDRTHSRNGRPHARATRIVGDRFHRDTDTLRRRGNPGMCRCCLAPLVVILLLVGLAVPRVRAAERCTMSCRAEVAACRRTECGSARGAARGECIEKRCRGPLGCPTRIGTLAYVVTRARCRPRDRRLTGGQELWIRRGDCDPVMALRLDTLGEVDDLAGLCATVARNRAGFGSGLAGVFQRLGVTPDGSGVVFEVTNEFELIGHTPLAAEQQGFFYVRADGSGLHRLGPASRDKTYRIYVPPTGEPIGIFQTYLPFSPSGRLVACTDLVRTPDGSDATQIFTLDLATRRRTQVTGLPPLDSPESDFGVSRQAFLDEQTIQFVTRTQEEGNTLHTIRTDGSGSRAGPLLPESVSASRVAPVFSVATPTGRIVSLVIAATPENPSPSYPDAPVVEVFRVEGRNILQLTSLHRYDTREVGAGRNAGGSFVHVGSRVLLMASADRFGENRFNNCQLFSIDSLGSGLRQLTHFDEGAPSVRGCSFGEPPGCSFADVYQDPMTR
jgi:hypothetical protein